MDSKHPSSAPILHPDGSIGARLTDKLEVGVAGTLLQFELPSSLGNGLAGRFLLARCAPDTLEDRLGDWSIYARRPLFVAGPPQHSSAPTITLLLPQLADPGYAWLRRQPLATRINLTGPYGQPADLPGAARTLLIVCTEELAPLMLPLAHAMLDRGGRVTFYIQTRANSTTASLPLLPIAVEVHPLPPIAQWSQALQSVLRWADFLVAALDLDQYAALAQAIRTARFRLEPGFALALSAPSLICGFGACLACVVPTTDGSLTRACVHGPLFALEQLVR